jgi:CheY-like chemotaxis protein
LIDSDVMSIPAATLLVVEDDPEISRLVGEFLRREGFEVEIAADGSAMDRALQRLRPDLIILDLMLPGEDGAVDLPAPALDRHHPDPDADGQERRDRSRRRPRDGG